MTACALISAPIWSRIRRGDLTDRGSASARVDRGDEAEPSVGITAADEPTVYVYMVAADVGAASRAAVASSTVGGGDRLTCGLPMDLAIDPGVTVADRPPIFRYEGMLVRGHGRGDEPEPITLARAATAAATSILPFTAAYAELNAEALGAPAACREV
jgi:hypothetical protein